MGRTGGAERRGELALRRVADGLGAGGDEGEQRPQPGGVEHGAMLSAVMAGLVPAIHVFA